MRPREQYALLLNLSSPGGPLSSGSEFETVQDTANFRELANGGFRIVSDQRRKVHAQIKAEFWSPVMTREGRGGKAIIMAGPPGAGKSTALPVVTSTFFQGEPFAIVDGDDLKDALLRDAISNGLYDSRFLPLVTRFTKGDARFFPMDFSGLVHRESMIIHAALVKRGIARHANLVIDGTLAWRQYGEEILKRLHTAGYATQLIVDVEASRHEAEAHAYARWSVGHVAAIQATDIDPTATPMGGRIVPSIAYDNIFESGPAKTLTNARSLAEQFKVPVMVFFPARNVKAAELVFDSATGGSVTMTATSGRIAGRCSVCGRAIWSSESLARGAGPGCASKLA